VHAVRARPLPAIKNNIEPDEQREEADTIPPRGVLTPRHAALLGLRFVFPHMQALLCHGVGLSPKTERPCLLAAALSRKTIMRATRAIMKGLPMRTHTLNIKHSTLNISSLLLILRTKRAGFHKVVGGDFDKAGAVYEGIPAAAHALAKAATGHKLMNRGHTAGYGGEV